MARKGNQWKPIDIEILPDPLRQRAREYVARSQEAQRLGRILWESLTKEWDARHPEGRKGLRCVFLVANGTPMYDMTASPMISKGDDPFEDR